MRSLATGGLAALQEHSTALCELSPLDWQPSVVDQALQKTIPVIGRCQKYHRGHHARSIHVLERMLARRAGPPTQAIASSTAWQQGGWDSASRHRSGAAPVWHPEFRGCCAAFPAPELPAQKAESGYPTRGCFHDEPLLGPVLMWRCIRRVQLGGSATQCS